MSVQSGITRAYRVLLLEAAAFGTIITVSWLDELWNMRKFHTPYNLHEALTETTVTLLVALPCLFLTWRVIGRLYYLEGFWRICAWCKRVNVNGEWMSLERLVQENLNVPTTHGICDLCREDFHSCNHPKQEP